MSLILKQNQLAITTFGILILYYLQGILYPEGSFLSQGLILIFLLIGIYFYCKILTKAHLQTPVKIWIVFCAVQIITFLISPKFVIGTKYEAIGVTSTFSQFKNIAAFSLSIFIGLRIGKQNSSSKLIAKIGLVLVGLCVLRYFYTLSQLRELLGNKDVTNNAAYNFVTLIPFLPIMFSHYKRLTIFSIFIIISFTIAGAKRGAIVCLAVSLIFIFVWSYKKYGFSLKKFALGILAVISIGGFIVYRYQQNQYLQHRMEYMEKKGIGAREVGYTVLFDHWVEDKNLFTQLFGNGSTQTVTVWGNFAHNDWLELLIDNGLLGVILYASFFISSISFIVRNRMDLNSKLSCYLFLLIWFCKTCFSMGYTGLWNVFPMLLLGIEWGKYRITRHKILINH